MALRVNPHDGGALVNRDEQMLGTAEDPRKLILSVEPRARLALAQNPLNPRAIRLLAAAADLSKDRPKALRLLALSQRISRRDLGTHLALIEYYSSIGNVDATLNQYDLALTSSGSANDTLFPILAGALTEPEIRSKMAPYVRADRPWLRGFVAYSIANADQIGELALLIRQSGGLPKHTDYRELETNLLSQLIARKKYTAARDFFLTLPGASLAMLQTAAFTPDTANRAFGPMAWYFSDESEASGQLGEDGKLWVRTAPGKRGTAAQRILFLSPGRYVFQQTAEFAQDAGSAVWELRCMRESGATMIWQYQIPASRAAKAISSPITIFSDCPTQMLTLGAMGEDSQQEAEMTFSSISLRPANH